MQRLATKSQSNRGDNPSSSRRLGFWRRNKSRPDPPTINDAKTEGTPQLSRVVNPASPIYLAIERLNTSITRLFEVNRVLDAEFNPKSRIDCDISCEVNITLIDSEIEKIVQLTDRLLAKEKSAKDFGASHQGILPATARFVKTVCQAVAPAAKTILVTVSQGSSLVMSLCVFGANNNQIPVLSPYSILFTSLSTLIGVRSVFQPSDVSSWCNKTLNGKPPWRMN